MCIRWWVVSLWAVAVGLGWTALFAYGNTAGPHGVAPARWPDDTALPRFEGEPQVVLFAHPRCPCTASGLDELAELLPRLHLPARVLIVVAGYAELPASGSLRERAARIPGVRLFDDPGARECRRFGAATSGAVVAYDAAGRLRYSGGVTASRAHAGDNRGAEAVLAVLRGEAPALVRGRVFGCPLFAEGDG